MRIYTKTGDKGETSLFGGKRVWKDSLRIQAYGTVDELNSLLGVIRSMKPRNPIDRILGQIQQDLFTLGSDLAAPEGSRVKAFGVPRIEARHVSQLEEYIDQSSSKLAPLRRFILPGGHPIASSLHLARTVCRRAEREAVRLGRREPLGRYVLPYMNRLSDLLFVLARLANAQAEVGETLWKQSMSG
jgi:cob(I)alamin adenosyltransferase